MIRPPRMSVTWLMAFVAVVATALGVVRMKRESDRRAEEARDHEKEAGSWRYEIHHRHWHHIHKAGRLPQATASPPGVARRRRNPSSSWAIHRTYRADPIATWVPRVRSEPGDVFERLVAYHARWPRSGRASRSPWTIVEPDPPPPVDIDDSGILFCL